MTREEASFILVNIDRRVCDDKLNEALDMAITALEQEPCDVFDEYGNYKYPSDVELTEPNTATSMPCEDAISREKTCDYIAEFINHEYSTQSECEMVEAMIDGIQHLPPVNPQPKTDVLDKIMAEIKTKYDSIPWRNNDYDDGWVEALEWVFDDVIDKYKTEKE